MLISFGLSLLFPLGYRNVKIADDPAHNESSLSLTADRGL